VQFQNERVIPKLRNRTNAMGLVCPRRTSRKEIDGHMDSSYRFIRSSNPEIKP